QLLADPAVITDRARYAQLAKEHGALSKQVKPYQEYLKVTEEIGHTQELLNAEQDGDMRHYLEEELAAQKKQQAGLQARLEDLLLVEGENYGSIILEIRAGTGGDEAALFAGDLYDMYTHFARDKGWKVEDISFSHGEQGGFKEVVFSVTGDDAYQHLRYESGGHRVQRVPKTEQQGTLIGSGDRIERIRTYNFPQNHVTDHRINLNLYKLDAIIAGELEELIGALKDYDKKQRLQQQQA